MKIKKYLFLYYFNAFLTFLLIGYSYYVIEPTREIIIPLYSIINYINIGLVLVFTFFFIKKKTMNINSLIMPISYLIFFIIVLIICFLFNDKVVSPYIHFGYYQLFILIAFILLNIYSILSIKFKN